MKFKQMKHIRKLFIIIFVLTVCNFSEAQTKSNKFEYDSIYDDANLLQLLRKENISYIALYYEKSKDLIQYYIVMFDGDKCFVKLFEIVRVNDSFIQIPNKLKELDESQKYNINRFQKFTFKKASDYNTSGLPSTNRCFSNLWSCSANFENYHCIFEKYKIWHNKDISIALNLKTRLKVNKFIKTLEKIKFDRLPPNPITNQYNEGFIMYSCFERKW